MQEDSEPLVLGNFSWIIAGHLAGVARPRTEEALALLQDLGVIVFITLTEDALPPDLLTKHRLQAYHSPIRDFTAPSVEQATRIVAKIQDYLEEGQVVAVHCGAGLGRTGTILACYLVAEGMS